MALDDPNECLACRGSGFIDISGEPQGCPYCFGRGVREADA